MGLYKVHIFNALFFIVRNYHIQDCTPCQKTVVVENKRKLFFHFTVKEQWRTGKQTQTAVFDTTVITWAEMSLLMPTAKTGTQLFLDRFIEPVKLSVMEASFLKQAW